MKQIKLHQLLLLLGILIFATCQKPNTPPTADFTISPVEGNTDSVFTFDASLCSDKQDDQSTLQVHWDWENNGNWDTDFSTHKIKEHQYSEPGKYSIILEVKDAKGLMNSTEKTLYVTPSAPIILTDSITNISPYSAQGGGNVISEGSSQVTTKGICWSTEENPDLENECTNDGTGLGKFVSTLTDLSPNTIYYVRAYAINSVDTTFGNQINFISEQTLPMVNTLNISNIEGFSAQSGDNIYSDGGSPIIARGVCWSNQQDPNIINTHTIDGNGVGIFVSSITNLLPNTIYYIRAYATNSKGTGYGNQRSFTTATIPTVYTALVTLLDGSSATGGVNVHDNGRAKITACGICWNTDINPNLRNDYTIDGAESGVFASLMTNLTSNITYYVRAYATNSAGTAYGQQRNFTIFFSSRNTILDNRDGKTYETVRIGNQWWMAENLNYGIMIEGSQQPSDNGIAEKYCYNNEEYNCHKSGGLYNWNELMNYTTQDYAQGLCPDGWHIPSDIEWNELELFLGMNSDDLNVVGWRESGDVGQKLKAYSGWYGSPNGVSFGSNKYGTNESGFNGLPGGRKNTTGSYSLFTEVGFFWTSTILNNDPYYRSLSHSNVYVNRDYRRNKDGLSIRCIKNDDDSNQNPTASFEVTPLTGNTSTIFAFDANGCRDYEDKTSDLKVRWDWNNDGSWDTDYTYEKYQEYQYTTVGQYSVRLEVLDTKGLSDQMSKSITVIEEEVIDRITDERDGEQYTIIKIGDQWWFTENLRYLPHVSPVNINGGIWVYGYDGSYVNVAKTTTYYKRYGCLYNWDVAINACPSGWHLPSDEEWKQLEVSLGMDINDSNSQGWRESGNVGQKLKSTTEWLENGNGTNESGLNVFPGGITLYTHNFSALGWETHLWSSSEYNENKVWIRYLYFSQSGIVRSDFPKDHGLSVRCVKD